MHFTRLIANGAIFCFLFTGSLVAQVSSGGTPISFTTATQPDIHTVTMPPVDVAALLAEDSIEQAKDVPYRFGFPFEVDYDLHNSGTWEDLDDGGRLWRLRIKCPGAYSINLVYNDFWLPKGARLFIYNEDRSMIIGAFTEKNNKEYREFATKPVKGDVTILEYHEPADVGQPGIISISRVVYGYKDIFDWGTVEGAIRDYGDADWCEININCPEGDPWYNEKRSVAMILLADGTRICSGALVNNVREDERQYFLTANHCGGGQATWIFMFNYESPFCPNEDGPTNMTVQGSVQRAANAYSDFLLVEINEAIPDAYKVYYSGWDAQGLLVPTAVGIHHPKGDIKKIALYPAGTISDDVAFWKIVMSDVATNGTIEHGSSGSPLYDPDHRVIGQVHAGTGPPYCVDGHTVWYGKFNHSMDYGGSSSSRLRDWLDPDNTGTLLLDGLDAAQHPHILSTSPAQNELNVPVNANISVSFDVNMDETTINGSTFVVNARSTGLHEGTITYDSQTKTATFDPNSEFDVGEVVTVILTTEIQSSRGASLESSYLWSFTTIVDDGSGIFVLDAVYPVGEYPFSVFAADLDSDGDLDLTTANRSHDNVSVLLNNGDGTFAPHLVYPVGDDPFFVFAADLDGDGDLDLTTANWISNNVSVLLNNGDGTFASHSVYSVANDPSSVFAADLDGDGDLDLTTANRNSNNVSVLLNNGDGTFAPHLVYPVGGFPTSVFAADLDGDGDLDLATANFVHDNVSVLLNKGDGTFASHSVYSVANGPSSVFAVDLDGDSDLDLATVNQLSGDVSVLLNNGDGTFAPHLVYPVGDHPFSVFAADLDGDGDLDLATANYFSDDVSVLLNNGDGTFAPHLVYPVGDDPLSVFAADLDGDGNLDLATANYSSSDVSVLLNQCCNHDGIRGDVDISGTINVGDVAYLVAYLFGIPSGPEPPCFEEGDADGSGSINVGDVDVLLDYLFGDPPGPAPPPCP